jgi:hypothetical protein
LVRTVGESVLVAGEGGYGLLGLSCHPVGSDTVSRQTVSESN